MSQAIIGLLIPPLRSSIASSSSAVPSQSAPAACAAIATGNKPCPYASALTTANTCASVLFLINFKLWVIAERLTSAQARLISQAYFDLRRLAIRGNRAIDCDY